jgi:hypothetical protein
MTDNIFKTNLTSEKIRKGELTNKLNDLWKKLKIVNQDDRPVGLKDISAQLIADIILHHTDRDVRLIACCCLVEIFRFLPICNVIQPIQF